MKTTGTLRRADSAPSPIRSLAWAPRWTGDGPRFVDELVGWLLTAGRRPYDGQVTLLEHALQTAALATVHGARESLVVAALLHDVGHPLAEVASSEPVEVLSHERLAASWLGRYFPASVTEPIRLHVQAKRWLVANEPGYVATLSAGSVASLVEQGGPMGAEEVLRFQSEPFAAAALSLRRWDEEACRPGARCASLEAYRAPLLRQLAPGR